IEEESWDWIDRHAQICNQPHAPEIYNILSANNGFLPPITKGCDRHFLNLVHTLEYFREKLPGYNEHCPSIFQDQYPSFVCQKCFRYYPTKMFLKLHIKTTHSNEKAPKSGVTNEETESLPRDYGCNVENTKDNEISNHEIRNVQVFQEEKPVKKGKSRPHQQNLTAKPWEQDHLTFKI
ncbi:23133_t:CDS:2, partial [Rhizophagus irregularis]